MRAPRWPGDSVSARHSAGQAHSRHKRVASEGVEVLSVELG